jgi:ferredoxin
MSERGDDGALALRLREGMGGPSEGGDGALAAKFATRLAEVAAHPDRVPISLNGRRLDARRGGTLLGAALRNRMRLMHVCGARKLCSTCRVRVDEGGENLSPMSAAERLSLRLHLSVNPRTRLACQARVLGPVEVEATFPMCGELAEDHR